MPTLIAAGVALTLYLAINAWFDVTSRHRGAPGHLAAHYAAVQGEVAAPPPGLPAALLARWSRGLPWRQVLPISLAAAGAAFLLTVVLVRSTGIAVLAGAAVGLIYPSQVWAAHQRRRRELITEHLRDALHAVAASLRAGAALPSALDRAADDLERMLADQPHRPLVDDLRRISADQRMGSSLDEALGRWRDRVQIEEVSHLVSAILLCKARGGNLPQVMTRIAETIGDKLAVQHQVRTLTAGKRMESRILTLAPPVLVILQMLTAPEYMAPLYELAIGKFLMVLGLVFLAGAYWAGRRIVAIDV